MKKIIVTGANGFIGRWLVKELSDHRFDVYAVVRPGRCGNIGQYLDKIHLVECDMTDYADLPDLIGEHIDTFYHLAWAGVGGQERADYEKQLLNEKYACDAAMAAARLDCRRFICTGTITERLIGGEQSPVSDNMIYGICKASAKQLLDVICKRKGMKFVWAQLSNIYGPYNTTGNIMNYLLGELLNGRNPEFSKGEEFYDLMYVEDTVCALRLLGESGSVKGKYFIGSGTPMLLKEYLERTSDFLGKSGEIRIGAREDDGLHYSKDWFCTDDLREDTGYMTRYSLEQGVAKTVDWMKEAQKGVQI